MRITYTYTYFGTQEVRTPPPELQAAVERIIPMVHPEKAHTLTTGNTAPFLLEYKPVRTNPAWIVTLTPVPVCQECGAEQPDDNIGVDATHDSSCSLYDHEAHRKADPHCTCNDCMADFSAEQREG